MEDVEFPSREMMLFPGDSLLLYTDGVVEAMNEKDELFGDEALLEMFDHRRNETPKEMVKKVFAAVEKHEENSPQSDDITVMVFDFVSVAKPALRSHQRK